MKKPSQSAETFLHFFSSRAPIYVKVKRIRMMENEKMWSWGEICWNWNNFNSLVFALFSENVQCLAQFPPCERPMLMRNYENLHEKILKNYPQRTADIRLMIDEKFLMIITNCYRSHASLLSSFKCTRKLNNDPASTAVTISTQMLFPRRTHPPHHLLRYTAWKESVKLLNEQVLIFERFSRCTGKTLS